MITFRVPSEELSSLLQSITRVIPSMDPNPLRKEILFEIKGNKLKVTGSNSFLCISGTIDLLEASEDCCFTIPPASIVDYVSNLSDRPLTFTYDFNDEVFRAPLTITFDGGAINFTASNGETYPGFDKSSEDNTCFSMKASDLRKGITNVLPFVSLKNMMEILEGVYFGFYPDYLDVVASDSYILSKHTIKKSYIPGIPVGEKKSFTLPHACATFLKTFLPKYEDQDLAISFNQKNIEFKVDNVEITSLLLNSNYPHYEKILPESCQYRLVMDTSLLKNVLHRMLKFVNVDENMFFIFEPKSDNEMRISIENVKERKSAVEVLNFQNENNFMEDISFSSKRMSVLIDNINSPNIIFEIIDRTRAILIKPSNNDAEVELLNLSAPSVQRK